MRKLIAALLGYLILLGINPTVFGQVDDRNLILGDLSGSMRGYATGLGANRLASLYQLLLRNLPTAELQALSTKIASVPNNQSRYFASPNRYGGNTDLLMGLRTIHQRNTITVLVTDGMQSEGMYLDIIEHLKHMAKEGWGIWLFALDMPFDGIIDCEQSVDLNALQAEIESCIHTNDSNATIKINKNASRIYNFKGNRPLLVFVLSKDAQIGRRATQDILLNLQTDPQFSSTLKVVELAPLYHRGVTVTEPKPIDTADYIKVDNFSSGNPVIHSDTVDEKRVKEIRIPLKWNNAPTLIPQAASESPRYNIFNYSWLEEEPEIENSEESGPLIGNVKIKVISEKGFFRRNFCWLPFVACHEKKAEVMSFIVWSDFVAPESSWWKDMSIDTSWQCPTKVYKLFNLVNEISAIAVEQHEVENKPERINFELIVGPL